MKRLFTFLDDRTGYRALLRHALDEEVRGGTRWAYVFGSALAVIFGVQMVTGLLMMATYTPSVQDAWSSVFYLQHRVTLGWLVRGLHHYGAQAMVIVLGFHMLQVVLYGAYKRPREVTWWMGLGLLGLVQGLALTGYLLPWDQKGYWATTVATNIAGSVPLIGEWLQTAVVGGPEYGQTTLTRFYALHVGALPLAMIAMVASHVALFRKHGVTAPAGADLTRVERFHPGQLGRDVIFAALIVGVMVVLSWKMPVPMDAPADPSSDYPPRPEWYFLFLFQMLKYIPGDWEIVGTVILPGLAGAYLFAMPLLDRRDSRRVRDRVAWVVPVLLGGVGIVALTAMSIQDDRADEEFQEKRVDADARARRAIQLARSGIPPGGPLEMLRNDPMTHGRDLYAQYCTSCHVLDGQGEQKAPDHTGFGSREWLLGLLRRPQANHFFGKAELAEDMPSQSRLGEEALAAVTELLYAQGAEARERGEIDQAKVRAGEQVMHRRCMECHIWHGEGDEQGVGGPTLTGYPSRTWIHRQIRHPSGPTQYGELSDMPSFADELDDHDVDMVAAYLRRQRTRGAAFLAAHPPR